MQIKTVTELLQCSIVKCLAKGLKVYKLLLIRCYSIIDSSGDGIFVKMLFLCIVQGFVAQGDKKVTVLVMAMRSVFLEPKQK